MSGYGGSEDEQIHALILNENGIAAARAEMPDTTKTWLDCMECGDLISDARRKAMPGACRCIACQEDYDKLPKSRVKMLTHLL